MAGFIRFGVPSKGGNCSVKAMLRRPQNEGHYKNIRINKKEEVDELDLEVARIQFSKDFLSQEERESSLSNSFRDFIKCFAGHSGAGISGRTAVEVAADSKPSIYL